jgi:hypothetical protein
MGFVAAAAVPLALMRVTTAGDAARLAAAGDDFVGGIEL